MPKFLVHRTVNQTIAIDAVDATAADAEASESKGEVIEHSTNQRVTVDTRPVRPQTATPK